MIFFFQQPSTTVFAVDVDHKLSADETDRLCWLFRGATVIDKNGKIRYFGCIADISKVTAGGIKGTGETAASLLAQNGMAIKISQDGPIKIFMEGIEGHIPF